MRREPPASLYAERAETTAPRALRVAAGLVLTAGIAMVALGGCGSRGPLDDEYTNVVADSGPEAAPPVAEAGPEAATPEAGREAGAVDCGICVVRTCGSTILECLQSPSCRSIFQCVATDCVAGGGGFSPTCLFQCAGDDPSGALGILSIFQCLTNDCGADCGSLLGGLGGFGGGGGGGKGGGNGGKGGGKGAPEAFREVFSPWPELLTPAPRRPPR